MEIKEVFEPIINFIKNFQKKDKDISKQAAKDRLKLVLMQDRASVSPDFFEMMKKEIIDVIKKYIEIDEESLEVQLTRGFEAGLEGPALYANIPIKNIKPVAPNGDEVMDKGDIEKLSEVIAEEILEEAEQKVEKIIGDSAEEIPQLKSVVEIVSDDIEVEPLVKEEVMSADSIAENVAKGMKKSTKATTKTTTSKAVATKATKKTTTSKTAKKVIKKSTDS